MKERAFMNSDWPWLGWAARVGSGTARAARSWGAGAHPANLGSGGRAQSHGAEYRPAPCVGGLPLPLLIVEGARLCGSRSWSAPAACIRRAAPAQPARGGRAAVTTNRPGSACTSTRSGRSACSSRAFGIRMPREYSDAEDTGVRSHAITAQSHGAPASGRSTGV